MATTTQTVRLSKPQSRAYRALQPGNTVCIPWGRGGGKSYFQRLYWYLLVAQWDGIRRPGAEHPGVRIALLMPTLEQAKKVHAELMLSELYGPWAHLGGKVNKSDWRVTFPGGSWIQWATAERIDNARGIRCDVGSVDECDDVDPGDYDAVIVPWFSEPHSLGVSLLSGTPRRGRFGLLYRTHKRASEARFADHKSFHATCYDFPEHVSARAIERARRGDDPDVTPEIFRREWLCDFDAAQGLVYSHFDEAFHVREPHPNTVWSEMLVGGDHGWEDPGCLLLIGISGSGRDATAHVLHEVYAQHKSEDWWVAQASQIVGWYPSARWYCDPSRPDRIAAFKSKAGARIEATDNAIEDGVAFVANMLVRRHPDGLPEFSRLYVSPQCRNLIAEFGKYRRKRARDGQILESIEDKHNHAMDTLRYALFSRFKSTRDARGRNDAHAEKR